MRAQWGRCHRGAAAGEGAAAALFLALDRPPSTFPPPPDTTTTCCCFRLQLLELDVPLEQAAKYSAVDKWAAQLQSLHSQVVAKLVVA